MSELERNLAITLLRQDKRRDIYEGADATGKRGSGIYYVSYSPDTPCRLTRGDINVLVRDGWITQHEDIPGFYKRGWKLERNS